MKHFTFDFDNQIHLAEFIKENKIDSYNEILLQVFTFTTITSDIKLLQNIIKEQLPQAKIIGSSTCGEIDCTGYHVEKTILSFSCFEKTKVETKIIQSKSDSFSLGRSFINTFSENLQNTKVLITFTDGLNTNGEEYLNGINSCANDLVIAGGMAGDYSMFKTTCIFNEDTILENGAVGAILINPNLNIHTEYSFNWEEIGKKHQIQSADKNRVYRINNQTPVEFYSYYLGKDIADLLPAIGVEFPLIIEKNGVTVARAVLNKHEDGSLSFAGNIETGSYVKFGFGNVNMILEKSKSTIESISKRPAEAIYIYSCMARKHLLKKDVNLEILPFAKIAPISGFFTYGEFFYHKNRTQLLNESMTILAISESKEVGENLKIDKTPIIDKDDIDIYRIEALSKLVTKTTQELEDLNKTLEHRVEYEVKQSLEKDSIVEANTRHAQMGEMMEMILHQWRQPLSALYSNISYLQIQQEIGELNDSMLTEYLDKLLEYVKHLNSTVDDFRSFFRLSNKNDTTKPSQLIEKIEFFTKPICHKYKIEYIKDIEFDEEIDVHISKILQVFLNIAKNSIDVLIDKKILSPYIKIRVHCEDNFLVFSFLDNGGGIEENIIDKVFEKRFTTKGEHDGTGIGLYMSKVIIESHFDGKIVVSNEENGASFKVYLSL